MPFALRPLIFKLHLYISIVFGLYVSILGVTGSILAFQREIDRFAHGNLAYVTPASPRLSLAAIDEAVLTAYPGATISQHVLGEAPNLATAVRAGRATIYVNPYTGDVLGQVTQGADAVTDALNVVHNIHEHLAPFRHGPRAGAFLGWTCVAALFLVISGIWLWFPRVRFGISAGRERPFWYDVHATFGVAAAALLILLTASGILLSFNGAMVPMMYALTGSISTPEGTLPPPPPADAQPISPDRALAIAKGALPGATPTAIYGPTPQRIYAVFARTRSDSNPSGRSYTEIDQYSGAVLYAEILDKAPGGARLLALTRAIHTGDVFGAFSKTLMALASLIIALQAVTGAVMWTKRVPFRSMVPALAAAGAVAALGAFMVFAPA